MNYIKVNVGTLPYRLAFRKFKIANGISLSGLSFAEEGKVQQEFDNIYGFNK